jgi:hypothetical protein
MKILKPCLAAALAASVLASRESAADTPTAANPPAVLSFATSCAVVDEHSADGYVTNLSTDTYQVTGAAQFVFSSQNDATRPSLVTTANSMIPAGQTARVAHVKLASRPLPGEKCWFEVDDAIRKP